MCCGSSRSVGLRPQSSILLGEETKEPAQYLYVADGELVPSVSSGAYRYFRGSSVEQAIEEGKLQVASPQRTAKAKKVTKFRVTLPDQSELDFTSHTTARQYAVRNGGTTRVVQEDIADA